MALSRRIFCFFSFLMARSKTYWYYCDDGTTRLVYRDVKDAIPIPKNENFSAEIDLGAKNLMEDSASLAAKWQDQVHPLIDSLGEKALDRYRLSQSKVFAYQINPCAHDEYFLSKLEEEIEEYYSLQKFRDSIRAFIINAKINPDDPKNSERIEEICKQMLGINNKICIKKEIRESHKRMNEWIEKGGPGAS